MVKHSNSENKTTEKIKQDVDFSKDSGFSNALYGFLLTKIFKDKTFELRAFLFHIERVSGQFFHINQKNISHLNKCR